MHKIIGEGTEPKTSPFQVSILPQGYRAHSCAHAHRHSHSLCLMNYSMPNGIA